MANFWTKENGSALVGHWNNGIALQENGIERVAECDSLCVLSKFIVDGIETGE